MKAEASKYFLILALTLCGIDSISTLEPDGTVAPAIPPGLFAPDGEITDPTIPNPAPEFPAPSDGTPNVTSKSP